MWLTRRRSRRLPLELPRLDGSSWPNVRDSFAASTLYELGYREAFAPESHDITDVLLAEVLPLLPVEVAPEDEPYLRRVFSSAAQIGAGIGLLERQGSRSDEPGTDRQVAGALRVAAGDLPSMPAHQQRIALYLMQSGYYLARTDLAQVSLLVSALGREESPGAGPGT